MIPTDGLSHIQLAVRDLGRSQRFYTELLGMAEVRRLGARSVMLRTPGSREIFTLNENQERAELAGQMGGIAHFGFRMAEPADMAAVLESVGRAGGSPIEHGKRGNELYAFFTDPDGYALELFWAPD